MVYDHPKQGMADYHPGNVDGLSNLHVVCDSLLRMIFDHPVTIFYMVYDHPIIFGNLLEMVLFSTEFLS